MYVLSSFNSYRLALGLTAITLASSDTATHAYVTKCNYSAASLNGNYVKIYST